MHLNVNRCFEITEGGKINKLFFSDVISLYHSKPSSSNFCLHAKLLLVR